MKIAACYNTWEDWDILYYSVRNILPLVDNVIIVNSSHSNYGEVEISNPFLEVERIVGLDPGGSKIGFIFFDPGGDSNVMRRETAKRNRGLEAARQIGATHYLSCDADELYDPVDFLVEKQRFIDNPDLSGLVCGSRVYFGSPKLTIGMDTTLVPFIHKITPDLKHDFNRRYPFAWENGRNIRIDPTRSFNINSGVEWSNIIMEHYSWVRKDYAKKIRNSTARGNLERSTILHDLSEAKEGGFCQFYGKTLSRATVSFGIPCD